MHGIDYTYQSATVCPKTGIYIRNIPESTGIDDVNRNLRASLLKYVESVIIIDSEIAQNPLPRNRNSCTAPKSTEFIGIYRNLVAYCEAKT